MSSTKVRPKTLPPRSRVKQADTWDLASLYPSDAAWETAFKKWEKQVGQYEKFRGKLAKSPDGLVACLQFDAKFDRLGERLGTYAFLKNGGRYRQQRVPAYGWPVPACSK